MTKAEMKRALTSAIRNAYRLGHAEQGKHGGEAKALRYAEALVMPIHEMCIQQGIEEAFTQARQAAPVTAEPVRQAGVA